MRLIFASNDFCINDVAYEGFPILLWDNMESCAEANQFLRHYLLRGTVGSKKTWRVIGQCIYDYFGFLQAHGLAWHEVDRGDGRALVAAYREYSAATLGLARNTIRLRLVYVCEFYIFAKNKKWINSLPFDHDIRRKGQSSNLLKHVDGSGGVRQIPSVMPRGVTTVPKFLTAAQAFSLITATKNVHHRMMLRLVLGTGLRREEIATFPLRYVINPDQTSSDVRNVRVHLDPYDGYGIKTKGSKPRIIYMSRWLMKELFHYAQKYRGERAYGSNHTNLFLNQSGMPFAADGKGIERIVRSLGNQIGLRVCPHMLRHTYATHTLASLQQYKERNRIEPLVFLQHQLGHASIQTTMIYLHLANDLVDSAVLAHEEELGFWHEINDSTAR